MGPNLYGNTHYYDQNGNREYTGFEEDGTPAQNLEYNPRTGEPRLQVRVKETIQRAPYLGGKKSLRNYANQIRVMSSIGYQFFPANSMIVIS